MSREIGTESRASVDGAEGLARNSFPACFTQATFALGLGVLAAQ